MGFFGFFFLLELIPCSYEGMCVCVFYTYPQIHTVCSLGAWGPIYLHAVEGEGFGVGDKTKREAEKKEETAGNYGEIPAEQANFSTVPKHRRDQFTI